MSRLSPKNVLASPAPVPDAGMIVAPVAPARFCRVDDFVGQVRFYHCDDTFMWHAQFPPFTDLQRIVPFYIHWTCDYRLRLRRFNIH
jgi:hypothetical protein